MDTGGPRVGSGSEYPSTVHVCRRPLGLGRVDTPGSPTSGS